MWDEGCWNKATFEPLPHNAYCYHYFHTCSNYSCPKMNIFSIRYIACVRHVRILSFLFSLTELSTNDFRNFTTFLSPWCMHRKKYRKAIFILMKIHTYNVF